MDTFHGTSAATATILASGKVDVSKGGGELGRGFYTGEHLHLAKAWAFHVSGDKAKNVVQFSKPDEEVGALTLKVLSHVEAVLTRSQIKKDGATRTFVFEADMVWAPIVGNNKVSGDQCKWESTRAQVLLNGPVCTRTVL